MNSARVFARVHWQEVQRSAWRVPLRGSAGCAGGGWFSLWSFGLRFLRPCSHACALLSVVFVCWQPWYPTDGAGIAPWPTTLAS